MIALFIFLFILWAILHSITAGFGMKRLFRQRFGEKAYAGWYRFIFNAFAVLSFTALYLLIPTLLPQTVLWTWQPPYIYLAYAMMLIGIVGLTASLWVTNIWDFIGVRQVVWYLRGAKGDIPIPPFTAVGPYALVRHPLYFFTLLVLWANPVMTLGSLIFYAAITLYFWIGSYYEERKLARDYGRPYTEYMQRVPRMIPFTKLPRRETAV
ncbi:MAG TPA: isoprenylcysteine carboxylmethyltransferase family protein [Anaerolineae bacterium]|nr:isoprenylcysteine carboxylmethyltransferase family protein [Anaerolineae bacterium]HIP71595.1 isoprenylcysteine carboxylmethyltransferase family protein [Anaerolineae bacterium]